MKSTLNKRNMLIMGLIGLFLGIIVATGISVSSAGYNEQPNTGYMITSVIILTIGLGFWGSQMKPAITVDKSSLNQERLSKKEKTYIWIFSLINPIITGGVTYFLYKDTFPAKARQANIISFIAFIPWVVFILYRERFF